MSSIFSPKVVPPNVQLELESRKGQNGMEWCAKRFPWFRVTSMCSGCTDKVKELSSFKRDNYETNSYERPLPVVTGIEIKKQGELGTTKKATLKILAFTDAQLIELQKCYFIPGMSVRLEFGWSVSAVTQNKNTLPTPPTIELNVSDQEVNKLIRKQSTLTPGQYDGFQGMVVTFSYSLTEASTWDCSVDIIAAVEAFAETSTTGDPSYKCTTLAKGDDDKEVQIKRSPLYTALATLFKTFGSIGKSIVYKNAYSTALKLGYKISDVNFESYEYEGLSREVDGGDGWGISTFFTETLGWGTEEAYISWAAFESLVNNYCLPVSVDNKFVLGSLNSKDVLIAYHPDLVSCDPRVCLIPGAPLQYLVLDEDDITSAPNPAITGNQTVKLSSIRLNVLFLILELAEIEKGEAPTLRQYVLNVLQKMNTACGDLWTFDLACADEDPDSKTPRLSVVDTRFPNKEKPPRPYEIPSDVIGDKASILRSFKLDMKMTDSMKTQALYSNAETNVSNTTTNAPCGAKNFEPFQLSAKGTFTNSAIKKATKYSDTDKKCGDNEKPTELKELLDQIANDGAHDGTCGSAAARLKQMYEEKLPTIDTHCNGTLLPFDFGVSMDGIGGFGFGQVITSSRIPLNVKNGFDFQITSVEHSITPNDWITTISTVARYKTTKP